MTVQRRFTIRPQEIVGVQYACKKCGAEHLVPIEKSPFVVACPTCKEQWLLKEYAHDTNGEPFSPTVNSFAAALLKIPGTVIQDSVELTLRLEPQDPETIR